MPKDDRTAGDILVDIFNAAINNKYDGEHEFNDEYDGAKFNDEYECTDDYCPHNKHHNTAHYHHKSATNKPAATDPRGPSPV